MSLIHLRSATTSFVAVNDGDALPIVLHWGARLPDEVTEAEPELIRRGKEDEEDEG